jgi:hypothetical protein
VRVQAVIGWILCAVGVIFTGAGTVLNIQMIVRQQWPTYLFLVAMLVGVLLAGFGMVLVMFAEVSADEKRAK